jgi:hypothetical protein
MKRRVLLGYGIKNRNVRARHLGLLPPRKSCPQRPFNVAPAAHRKSLWKNKLKPVARRR